MTEFSLSVWTDARPIPGTFDWRRRIAELVDEAKLADSLGFKTFGLAEQHASQDGFMPAPLTGLAGLATTTSRIRLQTYILLLPLYQLRQVIEQAILVDLYSAGRLDLGVAAGNNQMEFDLFQANFSNRGKTLEAGILAIRKAFAEGEINDGPGGKPLPISPRPAQTNLPIMVGGLSKPAVDRAVRIGQGHLTYTYGDPTVSLPEFWGTILQPALARHHRTLSDFQFRVAMPIWVTDDPDRDWETVFGPALTYQQKGYIGRYSQEVDPMKRVPGIINHTRRNQVMIGTALDIAQRLKALHQIVPWSELAFPYRLPGISHEQAQQHLERVTHQLKPHFSAQP